LTKKRIVELYSEYIKTATKIRQADFLSKNQISIAAFYKHFKSFYELTEHRVNIPKNKKEFFEQVYDSYKINQANFHSLTSRLGWPRNSAYKAAHSFYGSTSELMSLIYLRAEAEGIITPSRDELDDRSALYKKRKAKTIKRYLVTAAMPEAELVKDAWHAMQNYAERNDAEIIVLPMRGMHSSHKRYTQELYNSTKNHFAIEYKLSANLVARDVKLFPAHRNPAYGNRDLAKKSSMIMAHTKQDQAPCQVLDVTKPRSVFTTGVITTRDFQNTLSGYRNQQELIVGGVVADVDSKTGEFFARHVLFQDDFISSMGKRYHASGDVTDDPAVYLKLGDIHSLFTEPQYKQASIEQINFFNVPEAGGGDWFDGKSISHYDAQNMIVRSKVLTLQDELDYLIEDVRDWLSKINCRLGMTASNHPEWINRYLTGNRWVNDPVNYRTALSLTNALLNHQDPIEYYFQENAPELCDRIQFYKRSEMQRLSNWLYTIHGDLGPDGARGSIHNQSAAGPVIMEHIHGAGKKGDVMAVGTLALQTLDYAANRLSSWQAQNIVIYQSGAAQQLWMSPRGKWKID